METKVYAGFFVRLIAFVIDSIITAAAVAVVKMPLSIAASSGVEFLKANFIFHYSFLDILDYVCVVAYFVLLTYFTHTTLGKAAMRLEVVTEDKEWTIWNILYRETIGRFFSSLLCVGYFAVLVSQKKQGFHDMLCDTYVVYKGMIPMRKPIPVEEGAEDTVSGSIVENQSVVEETAEETSVSEETKLVVDPPVYYQSPVICNQGEMNQDTSTQFDAPGDKTE